MENKIQKAFDWANKRLELSGDELNSNQMSYIRFALSEQLLENDNCPENALERNIFITNSIKAGNIEIAKEVIEETDTHSLLNSEKTLKYLIKKGVKSGPDLEVLKTKLKLIQDKLG